MELIDYIDYIKYERKLSDETIKNYEYDLEKFVSFLRKNGINSFSKVSQKDIEKQKINQSKNNGLQLPKTNGHRYFASALEAVLLAMLLIISKVYKKIRI